MNTDYLRVVIVGMGTQGLKRKQSVGENFVCFVDPYHNESDFDSIYNVPLESYDAAIICTPDVEKYRLIQYLIRNRKHVMCEKPLFLRQKGLYRKIQQEASNYEVTYYTAYNHRFEPSLILAKDIIQRQELGQIYFIKLFYGNGTAQNILNSSWRDAGTGVIYDLGSHLIDLLYFWFPHLEIEFKNHLVSRFETESPDYAILHSADSFPRITLEVTACMWKNTFRVDIVGSLGSLHVEGLAKWGQSVVSFRQRVFPSGIPSETITVFDSGDLTWQHEYQHFKNLIAAKAESCLKNDYDIFKSLQKVLKKAKGS